LRTYEKPYLNDNLFSSEQYRTIVIICMFREAFALLKREYKRALPFSVRKRPWMYCNVDNNNGPFDKNLHRSHVGRLERFGADFVQPEPVNPDGQIIVRGAWNCKLNALTVYNRKAARRKIFREGGSIKKRTP